ncbi:MAG: hypothetical protein DRO40_05265 [Thermoprotei archaeon]|nr:MAG: hypothetical protein DRO40_05265 [Thermoprotei archaeon]
MAKEFIVAVDTEGIIPDYTINYVVTNNIDEAYYLFAILLSPQINAVVQELSPWVGHVQPRFLRYFKIPRYRSTHPIHKTLANKGKVIHEKGYVDYSDLKDIESLVDQL